MTKQAWMLFASASGLMYTETTDFRAGAFQSREIHLRLHVPLGPQEHAEICSIVNLRAALYTEVDVVEVCLEGMRRKMMLHLQEREAKAAAAKDSAP